MQQDQPGLPAPQDQLVQLARLAQRGQRGSQELPELPELWVQWVQRALQAQLERQARLAQQEPTDPLEHKALQVQLDRKVPPAHSRDRTSRD